MKKNRISRRIFSLFGILGISVMFFACEPGKKTATTEAEPITETVSPGTESAEALDTRIRDLNQEFTSVEREVMASDNVTNEGFREDWRSLEVKRHDLNRKIELYNNAIERGAELEASELRTDINRLINELESELRSVKSNYGTGTDSEIQGQPDFQEDDREQNMEWPE
jgi:uncharacterized protein YlxW (UPF0749 family)